RPARERGPPDRPAARHSRSGLIDRLSGPPVECANPARRRAESLKARDKMKRIPRTHSRSRTSHQSADSDAMLRDQMLVALTDKSVILQVVEATHGATSWSASARGSSQRELQEGLDLIEVER